MASKKKGANLASVLKKNVENAPKNYGVEHDVENYKTRLSNAGIDAKEATDSRNFIEKALNLTEDQNVLFDIFEIMGRPQQALFGAIDAAQKGKNVGDNGEYLNLLRCVGGKLRIKGFGCTCHCLARNRGGNNTGWV